MNDRHLSGVHGIDDRIPGPPRSLSELMAEAALTVPHLVVLLYRLMRDPNVPGRRKFVAGLAAGYLVSPVDLIPDFVPFVSAIDDLIFVGFAVHHLLSSVPVEAQQAYWKGSEDALDVVRALAAWGAEMVPSRLRRALGEPA